MLSEPSLSMPITVGLYARWGSGKSFLLNKLRDEMKNFVHQWVELGWQWGWVVLWAVWHIAVICGAISSLSGVPWAISLAVTVAVTIILYLILLMLWYASLR
jgi:ankyrin repeat-rich membrane spanning protein